MISMGTTVDTRPQNKREMLVSRMEAERINRERKQLGLRIGTAAEQSEVRVRLALFSRFGPG